jgi:DNA-binding LytR/AlgR family response regulator
MPLPLGEPRGRRILVVEDNFLIAETLRDLLIENGCEVVGPVGRLKAALALAADEVFDGAFLDINLAGEQCFPLADVLQERQVPFVFLTGYGDAAIVPDALRDVPLLAKPLHAMDVAATLLRHFAPKD